ncbi:MAG TPA: prenyltransferase [Candidatus Xenobia bacterium]|jgi:1,4-dihydroxy-2-naphthoate octaprenyltransferase
MALPVVARLAKGLFMEARILAVLVWSTTAVTVGTALAARTQAVDLRLYVLALLAGFIGQGYTTHAINEIRDWTSGTDRHGLGGSKVVRAGLLSIGELWAVFWVSIGLVLWLGHLCAESSGPWAWFFIGIALLSGICYSLPPIQLAYRPYLGEWLGAFPGILTCVCGAYYVQTGALTGEPVLLGTALALQCMAIMLMFHTLDFEADRAAVPCKRTTIVHLGPAAAQRYLVALQVGAVLALGLALRIDYRLAPLLVAGFLCLVAFQTYAPFDSPTIIRASKRVTLATIAGGLATGIWIDPRLAFMIAVIYAAFAAHRRYGKLPR